MASYVLPNFNLTVAFWRFGRFPAHSPDVVTIGNLSPGKIVSLDSPITSMVLRLPKATDVQDNKNGVGSDTCECPYQSGRIYTVQFVDDIGGGFTNEHRMAILGGLPTWPIPFPPVGGFTPIIPPAPPTFVTAFSGLPGGSAGFTFNVVSTGGSISGAYVAINDTAIPTVSINGGANCILSGGGFDVNNAPLGLPQFHIYPFIDVGIIGTNTVHVQSGNPGLQLFYGYSGYGFGTGTTLTPEGANSGISNPASVPPYTPNPAHPKVHMAYYFALNPIGTMGTSPPFGLYGASSPAMVGLTTVQMWGGTYLAGIGGQFPNVSTGTFGPWVDIQHSYVP